jgi:hypothetical protein
MSNDNVPHPPGRLISLRNVVLRIEQEAKLAGSPHSAIELVLRALRCGEIHAVGVYAGDQTSRSIGPADWEGLIIEIAPQRIFEVNGPPTLVVRRLGAPGGSPEVTHVRLDALDVTAWRTRLRLAGYTPKPRGEIHPPAPIEIRCVLAHAPGTGCRAGARCPGAGRQFDRHPKKVALGHGPQAVGAHRSVGKNAVQGRGPSSKQTPQIKLPAPHR